MSVKRILAILAVLLGTVCIVLVHQAKAEDHFNKVQKNGQTMTVPLYPIDCASAPAKVSGSGGWCGGVETLGQKMRRLASRAAASNPLSQIPLSAPAAWQASTAYSDGLTVTNDTPSSVYVNQNANGCTSAGSGGPTGTGLAPITDNNCTWMYLGPSYPSTSSPLMPTITNTTSTPGGVTLALPMDTSSNLLYCGGASHTLVNSHFFQFWSSTVVSGGNGPVSTQNQGDTASCTFETDAPKFAIGIYCLPPRIIVDGVFVQNGGLPSSCAGSPSWQVLDYAGFRKRRRVTVQLYASTTFYGIRIDSSSKVWAPSSSDVIHAVFTGDSIVAGAYQQTAMADWPVLACFLLGWEMDCRNAAEGGTGYIATNGNAGYALNASQRLADVCNVSADILFAFAGINDEGGNTAGQITAAALATFQAWRACLPGKPIVIMGAWPGNTGPSGTRLATEAAILSAFNSWGDPLSYYIPVSNDPNGSWVTGTGKVGATTGTGNADTCIQASTAAPHPTQNCVETIAYRVNTIFRQSILPLIP